MGSEHMDAGLCDALIQVLRAVTAQDSPATLDRAMASVAGNCSMSALSLERLRAAGLESHVDADRRRRRESELQALLRVAHQLLASATLDASLDALVGATRALLSADVAHINVHVADGVGYHSVRAIQGEMTEAFRRQQTPPGAGLTGLVTETKSPHVSTDYLTDPRIRHSASGDASVRCDGLRTLVGVPVLHRDDVIAVLIVSYRATTLVSDNQLGLLVSLATLASLALEDARTRDAQAAIARKLQDDSTLLRANNASLEWSASSYEKLVELVLRRCGVGEFVSAMSQAFGCEAGMWDAAGQLIARSPQTHAPIPQRLSEIAQSLAPLATAPVVHEFGEDDDNLWLCVAGSPEEVLGAVYVRRDALDEVARRTFGRVGRLANQLLRDVSNGAAPGELNEETVAGLLDGRMQDDSTLDLSRSLGSSAYKSLVAVVALGDAPSRSRMHHLGVRLARKHRGGPEARMGSSYSLLLAQTPLPWPLECTRA